MISIQLHLNEDLAEAEKKLRELELNHWSFLNPVKKRKNKAAPEEFYKKSLKNKVIVAISDFAEKSHYEKYDLDSNTAAVAVEFFRKLKEKDFALLEKIVLSRPKELNDICGEIDKALPPKMLYSNIPSGKKQTKFGAYLSDELFNYGSFRSSQYCTDLYKTGMNGNLNTCPYCNLHLITIAKNPSNPNKPAEKGHFDIDHFFPLVVRPYLAVSFYNLIPCCHYCNASEKKDKEFTLDTHIHPYVECFDDLYIFKFDINKILDGDIQFKLEARNGTTRNDSTDHELNLTNRHLEHKLAAKDILEYYVKYNRLFDQDNQWHIDFFTSHFPSKKSHILRKPQAKLLRDFFQQINTTNILSIV